MTSKLSYNQTMATPADLTIRDLGLKDYKIVWQDMREFTNSRNGDTGDEIWLVEHAPVFTLGLNGKREHILSEGNIPVVKCDRGGQVTYHGPGQIVAYLLLDLRRRKLGVKQLVEKMEQAVIELLAQYGVNGERKDNAPGVYVNGAKIAALGLRVRRGCSYHGLSVNVDMDLAPFSQINPCGYADLPSVQLKDLVDDIDINLIREKLVTELQRQLL